MKLQRRLISLFLVIVMVFALGAVATAQDDHPEIILVENSWSASSANIAVAQLLLEEQGFPVEVIFLDESAQWPTIGAGDAHASLEVWPSGHADNVAQFIDDLGVVENGGALGPIGKIGWYIPTYMLDEHPELATWEGFLDPDNAALFATAETGDAGQFTAGAPGWTQYDAEIIDNLGINLEVVAAGSEEAILSQLSTAVLREEPFLFYFWTPHSIHADVDLTRVELPEWSAECYEGVAEGIHDGVSCDYPGDELFKILWSDLEEYSPEAYEFLTHFNYSTEAQISMIAAIELEGLSVQEAAQAWIDENEDVWSQWLPGHEHGEDTHVHEEVEEMEEESGD